MSRFKELRENLRQSVSERDAERNRRLDNMWQGPPGIEEQLHMLRTDISHIYWIVGRVTQALDDAEREEADQGGA